MQNEAYTPNLEIKYLNDAVDFYDKYSEARTDKQRARALREMYKYWQHYHQEPRMTSEMFDNLVKEEWERLGADAGYKKMCDEDDAHWTAQMAEVFPDGIVSSADDIGLKQLVS